MFALRDLNLAFKINWGAVPQKQTKTSMLQKKLPCEVTDKVNRDDYYPTNWCTGDTLRALQMWAKWA